jgi:cellulose synthase/poly-beta-1,6-N-acetylglucosamine synthase-like glycosyltransferase
LIVEILNLIFLLLTSVIMIYLIRHYVFTLTVLRRSKTIKLPNNDRNSEYEPTVSILIPARNEEKVIGNLLEKMTELSYPKEKLEVILIDDASLDNTGKIAEEYAKKYKFIKILHRDKRIGGKGKPAALNAGFRQSTGEIVLCFDADYLPNCSIVSKLVEKFADPSVGAVQGRPVVLNESQNIITRLIALERIGGYRVDQEARDILGLIP